MILAGLLYAGVEFVAGRIAEQALATIVEVKYPAARSVDANVSKPLLFGLFVNSRVDEIEVSISHVDLGEFIADRASAAMTDVVVDRAESIERRSPVIKSIRRLEMSLSITSAEASKILPEGLRFEFTPALVTLRGPRFAVKGQLVVKGRALVFQPAKGQLLPRGVKPPDWNLSNVPLVTCLDRVVVAQGTITVSCSIDDPPAKFPPERTG